MKFVTLIFEKGKTPFEKIIMGLQMIKAVRCGYTNVDVFSHVAILDNKTDVVTQTHPNHGVTQNDFTQYKDFSRRFLFTIAISDEQYINYLSVVKRVKKYNKYNKRAAFWSGVYMLTGKWFGRKDINNGFYCSSLVAYILNHIGLYDKEFYSADMMDLFVYFDC